ncbi:MAG: AraC family transcriptional regulator [Longibaculum sp.]
MKVTYDGDYENVESTLRDFDKNKYCMFIDQAGVNEESSIIEAHWHEWLEITYIVEGAMKLTIPEKTYYFQTGDIVMIGMQTLHRITGKQGKYRFQCLHVNIGFILQYINSTLLNEKVIAIENKDAFLKYFKNVIALMKHEDAVSELRYMSSLLELLSLCLEESASDDDLKNGGMNDMFSHILFYVGTHYQDNISLQELSDKFDYTTQYISLMFKKNLNTNYYTYLTKLRLDRARFLLTTSQKKIIDIALECGFSSEHSFINHFKKKYGLTPSSYRKTERTIE